MSLLAVGLSHRSAPLPVLERAALAAVDAHGLTDLLLAAEHLNDVVVLATCNRVEVYADTTRFHGGVGDVVRVLSGASGVDVDALTDHLYVHYDAAVADHLFAVTAGLDSMAVGESQILGQVRALWQRARARGVGRTLDELFQHALRVGKRAQSETGLDRRSNVLVDHALDRAAGALGTRVPRTLVVGAGAMAAVVVSSLARRRGDLADSADPWLTVVNRTRAGARRLAATAGPGARAAGWEELAAELAAAELVVTCTGSVGHVVDGRHLAAAGPHRLVLVDLALPRDVDPLAASVAGVTLLDLETLGAEVTALAGADEVAAARRIVTAEVDAWRAQQAAGGVAPTVVALREQAAAILEAELDRLDRRLPDLPGAAREEIRNAVRRVLEKVLHTPTVRVKELADAPGGSFYAEALRTLFDLEVADSVTDPGPVVSVVP